MKDFQAEAEKGRPRANPADRKASPCLVAVQLFVLHAPLVTMAARPGREAGVSGLPAAVLR